MPTHQIQRQIIELRVWDEDSTADLRREVSEQIRASFAQGLEELAQELTAPDRVYSLGQLNLDLGTLRETDWREELPGRVREALRKQLSTQLRQQEEAHTLQQATTGSSSPEPQSEEARQRALVSEFLQSGNLPWWVETDASVRKQQLKTALQAQLREPSILKPQLKQPAALTRMLEHLSDEQLLASWPADEQQAPLRQLLRYWQQIKKQQPEARQQFWENYLHHYLSTDPASPDLTELLESLVTALPREQQQTQFLKNLGEAPQWKGKSKALQQKKQQAWSTSRKSTKEATSAKAKSAKSTQQTRETTAEEKAGPAQKSGSGSSATGANAEETTAHPARERWLQQLEQVLQQPQSAGQLMQLLQLLQKGKTLLKGSPLQQSVADLQVYLQARAQHLSRLQAGLSPAASNDLAHLLATAKEALLAAGEQGFVEDNWLSWELLLQQELPLISSTVLPLSGPLPYQTGQWALHALMTVLDSTGSSETQLTSPTDGVRANLEVYLAQLTDYPALQDWASTWLELLAALATGKGDRERIKQHIETWPDTRYDFKPLLLQQLLPEQQEQVLSRYIGRSLEQIIASIAKTDGMQAGKGTALSKLAKADQQLLLARHSSWASKWHAALSVASAAPSLPGQPANDSPASPAPWQDAVTAQRWLDQIASLLDELPLRQRADRAWQQPLAELSQLVYTLVVQEEELQKAELLTLQAVAPTEPELAAQPQAAPSETQQLLIKTLSEWLEQGDLSQTRITALQQLKPDAERPEHINWQQWLLAAPAQAKSPEPDWLQQGLDQLAGQSLLPGLLRSGLQDKLYTALATLMQARQQTSGKQAQAGQAELAETQFAIPGVQITGSLEPKAAAAYREFLQWLTLHLPASLQGRSLPGLPAQTAAALADMVRQWYQQYQQWSQTWQSAKGVKKASKPGDKTDTLRQSETRTESAATPATKPEENELLQGQELSQLLARFPIPDEELLVTLKQQLARWTEAKTLPAPSKQTPTAQQDQDQDTGIVVEEAQMQALQIWLTRTLSDLLTQETALESRSPSATTIPKELKQVPAAVVWLDWLEARPSWEQQPGLQHWLQEGMLLLEHSTFKPDGLAALRATFSTIAQQANQHQATEATEQTEALDWLFKSLQTVLSSEQKQWWLALPEGFRRKASLIQLHAWLQALPAQNAPAAQLSSWQSRGRQLVADFNPTAQQQRQLDQLLTALAAEQTQPAAARALPQLEEAIKQFTSLKAALPLTRQDDLQQAIHQLEEWLYHYRYLPRKQALLEANREAQLLLRGLRQQLSAEAHKPSRQESAAQHSTADDGAAYYHHTAGLVLVWPFIRRLLARLAYLDEEGAFVDREHQLRAVMLLYYLCTGEQACIEPELPLCKLLCDVHPEEPVPVALELTEAEETEVRRLLGAVLAANPRVAKTGIDSFRANFMLREGVLKRQADHWLMQMEYKTHDILLQAFPWSWSAIKFPWTREPLLVQHQAAT